MTGPLNMAEAIRTNALIDAAWDAWAKQEPTDGTADEGDAWQAGYEAFEEASLKARRAVRELPCTSIAGISAKLSWLVTEDADNASLEPYALLSRDLAAILDRPTQDAFAVKLRAYDRAALECGEAKAAGADDAAMSPLYSAVHQCGVAVLLEPAPDMGALIEKRRIFDALQYQDDDENPAVTHQLFADAIALAGGAK